MHSDVVIIGKGPKGFPDGMYGNAFGWLCLFSKTNLRNQYFVEVKLKHIVTAVVGIEDAQVKFD